MPEGNNGEVWSMTPAPEDAERVRNRGFSLMNAVIEMGTSATIGAVVAEAVAFGGEFVAKAVFGVDMLPAVDPVTKAVIAGGIGAAAGVVLNGIRSISLENRIT